MGTHVDLSHAATPVGMRVTAQMKLVAVKDRKLRFKGSAGTRRRLSAPAFTSAPSSIRPGLARLEKKAAG